LPDDVFPPRRGIEEEPRLLAHGGRQIRRLRQVIQRTDECIGIADLKHGAKGMPADPGADIAPRVSDRQGAVRRGNPVKLVRKDRTGSRRWCAGACAVTGR